MIQKIFRDLSLMCLISQGHGAIVFNDTLNGVDKNKPRIEYDLDGNGTTDLGFFSFDGRFPFLEVTGPVTTSVLFSVDPIWGAKVAALPAGEPIDSIEGRPLFAYQNFSIPEVGFVLSRPLGDDPFPEDRPPFFDVIAYLGFSFLGEDDELHYGYALVEEVGTTAAFIRAIAYESEPNTAIITGAVPEPSSTLFVALGLSCGFLKRKRTPETRIQKDQG